LKLFQAERVLMFIEFLKLNNMEIVKKIRLLDGSEHDSKQRAINHLFNILSSGGDLELFDSLSNLSSLKVKNYFIDNASKIEKTMQIIRELKEVDNLKNFN
jgi:hypothetical protein